MFAPDVISPALRASFQDQFERMIVLDYVTRNTDRGHENWLIKVEKRADSTDPHWPPDVDERVRIAAIDNGLSFPFKHPDSWRTCMSLPYIALVACDPRPRPRPAKHKPPLPCPGPLFGANADPYYWAWLPQAKQPFSDDTRDTLLPLLVDEVCACGPRRACVSGNRNRSRNRTRNVSRCTTQGFVEGLIEELYEAFRRDKDFNKSVFRRQAAVMRGQILNLTTALKDKLSPWQLVQLPLCCINKDGQIKYIVCALPRPPRPGPNASLADVCYTRPAGDERPRAMFLVLLTPISPRWAVARCPALPGPAHAR
jgi:phosphatidylinositol 4-kinase type 2